MWFGAKSMVDIIKARKNLELKLEKERSHALNRYNQAVLDADAIIQCIKPRKKFISGDLCCIRNAFMNIQISILP